MRRLNHLSHCNPAEVELNKIEFDMAVARHLNRALDTNNLDDFLLKCAIDQSLSTQKASGYDAVESMKENPPKSLEEAFEQTLNSFPLTHNSHDNVGIDS